MADKNISQLTALAGEGINRTNDQVAVWDADATTTKKVAAQDFVTTGVQDPTGATTTRVNKVVALDQTAYDGIGTPDSETLYVITDGKTKDSYVGQIDTLADGTYTIDIYPVTDREITKLYVAWDGTTAGTLDFQVNGSTVGTQVDLTGTSPSDEDLDPVASVTAGQAITLVAASVDTITNVRFVVEYQS